MQCTNPIRIQVSKKNSFVNKYPDGLQVPCGKCLACRIQKRKEWQTRMLHELSSHKDNSFVTLTYNDDSLPANLSLVKSDLQKYFKRLRKSIAPHRIKYFACGEYGETTFRPHYHCIIFGLGLRPEHQQLIRDNWQKGHVHVGQAEPDSIGYVAGYIDKKYSGDLADEEYYQLGREPVFRISSNGLGRDYCDSNSEQIKSNLYITVRGVKQSVPRYYIKRLGIDTRSITDYALDRDCEITEKHTGVYITADELYKSSATEENKRLIDGVRDAKAQHNRNLHARTKLRSRKF